jgi:hypothetical protein
VSTVEPVVYLDRVDGLDRRLSEPFTEIHHLVGTSGNVTFTFRVGLINEL